LHETGANAKHKNKQPKAAQTEKDTSNKNTWKNLLTQLGIYKWCSRRRSTRLEIHVRRRRNTKYFRCAT